jgi:signal transduction histidine kinase
MPDGGVLSVRLEPFSHSRIRIIFEDSGNGMTPDQVEQLFEPFSNSTSGGTGLGLSIVYQIIRDHGGTINVRSSEGEGTVITIELPRKARTLAQSESITAEEAREKSRLESILRVKGEETKLST